MIQERFPSAVDYQTEHTRLENQGNALSCTAFGGTSAWEAMLHRLGKPWQLAARFIWYNMRGSNPSVESMARALEYYGVCLDEYCPYRTEPDFPYNPIGLYDAPNSDAWHDAKTRLPKGIKPVYIAGKEQVMRWLARGSALTAIKIGGPTEHCVAIIGYNEFGVKVHDSGNNIYWQPWSDLESGGCITQLYRWEGLELVPHPDYVEGDLPTFQDGALTLAKLRVQYAFPQPSEVYSNVEVHFADGDSGNPHADHPDVIGDEAVWNSMRLRLSLPKLVYNGQIYHNVLIENPKVEIKKWELI